jgi:hypothetical protein
MSSGWVECVGIADRSAFDLQCHSAATKVELVAREAYPNGPIEVAGVAVKANRAALGKAFKTDQVRDGEGRGMGMRGGKETDRVREGKRLGSDGSDWGTRGRQWETA